MTIGVAIFWTSRGERDSDASRDADHAMERAYARRAVGDLRGARDVVLSALGSAQADQEPYLIADLGRTAAQDGDYDLAISCFRRAMALDPEFPPTRYALASLLAFTGQLEEADRLFRQNIPVTAGNGDVTTTATIRFKTSA